jgi:hypothetical protein
MRTQLTLAPLLLLALAACDGDARATIRAQLVGQAYLEDEISRIQADASSGFRRRRHALGD